MRAQTEAAEPAVPVSLLATVMKHALPFLVSGLVAAATAYGGSRVEHVLNEQTRDEVAKMKAEAVPAARWQQHMEDRLDTLESEHREEKAQLDRIEQAVRR